jgi:hypothetical protein
VKNHFYSVVNKHGKNQNENSYRLQVAGMHVRKPDRNMAHKCYILGGGESGIGAAILAKQQGMKCF